MSVTLDERTEMLIQRQIDSGRFRDANEVIQRAIEALEVQQPGLEEIRAEVMRGVEQLERGEGEYWSPDLLKRLNEAAVDGASRGKPIKHAVNDN